MSDYHIDCELNYSVADKSTFIFKIEALTDHEQTVAWERLSTLPELPTKRSVDPFGTRTCKVVSPPGSFSIRYEAAVSVQRPSAPEILREMEVYDIPVDVLPYITGSRYVESELIFQDALRWIGTEERGYRRVARICKWVRENIRYEIGTSLPYGTTRDVLASRTGVCRDYAHVSIALCRALNIPARFVVGHVGWDTPPPDFHALFEAWLDGRWVLFDPTEMAPTNAVIRIGSGRDAADLPFATIFGSVQLVRMSPLVIPAPVGVRLAA